MNLQFTNLKLGLNNFKFQESCNELNVHQRSPIYIRCNEFRIKIKII